MKRHVVIAGLMSMMFCGGAVQAFAHGPSGMMAGGGDPFALFFLKQSRCVLRAKETLGLSEDQIKTIWNLKMEVKKTLIRQQADGRISDVEIFSALRESKTDAAGLQNLIDQKYDGKKAQAKTVANAYLKFRDTLTADQWRSLYALEKERVKGASHGRHFRHFNRH